MPPQKRYRCRYGGRVLPGWLPVAQRPDGAMLRAPGAEEHLARRAEERRGQCDLVCHRSSSDRPS